VKGPIMDRKTFLTLIPFLPALLKFNTNPTDSMHSNQKHIDSIKRESAKLKAIAELTKLELEKDAARELFWKHRKFDGFDF
jgi:hypothetical protein